MPYPAAPPLRKSLYPAAQPLRKTLYSATRPCRKSTSCRKSVVSHYSSLIRDGKAPYRTIRPCRNNIVYTARPIPKKITFHHFPYVGDLKKGMLRHSGVIQFPGLQKYTPVAVISLLWQRIAKPPSQRQPGLRCFIYALAEKIPRCMLFMITLYDRCTIVQSAIRSAEPCRLRHRRMR